MFVMEITYLAAAAAMLLHFIAISMRNISNGCGRTFSLIVIRSQPCQFSQPFSNANHLSRFTTIPSEMAVVQSQISSWQIRQKWLKLQVCGKKKFVRHQRRNIWWENVLLDSWARTTISASFQCAPFTFFSVITFSPASKYYRCSQRGKIISKTVEKPREASASPNGWVDESLWKEIVKWMEIDPSTCLCHCFYSIQKSNLRREFVEWTKLWDISLIYDCK